MLEELLDIGGYRLKGLNRVNIFLGKNGCGKSTALKKIEGTITQQASFGNVKYIIQERGGKLAWARNIEQNILNQPNWLSHTRRVNQASQFREESMCMYRKLETLCLREIETDKTLRGDFTYTFDSTIAKINELLNYIEIRHKDATFEMYVKKDGQKIDPDQISSGESEMISLAIECLTFQKEKLRIVSQHI